MSQVTVTRFAPSPTGYLHLGHAHSALFGYRAAEQAGGRFLLRIEDIDAARCRLHFETALIEDLSWLGLTWERPVRRQSEHLSDYRACLQGLQERGLLYPCFCTRKHIKAEIAASPAAPHGPDGPIYPGTCRRLGANERQEKMTAGVQYAWRLDMEQALRQAPGDLVFFDQSRGCVRATPEIFGDVVLARKDAPSSYHLCVVLDDAIQGVNLVTRGLDLFAATHIHRLLQSLLGLAVPRYAHHRLLTDADGKRLAKRHDAMSLRAYRQAGYEAADIRAMAGFAD